jgi:tRNA-intron endonuclease
MDGKIEAELVGTRLIVWDPKAGTELYRLGFYGKPVGLPKPKPDQEFNSPLMLDLMEGLYLVEKGIIEVVGQGSERTVKKSKIKKIAEKTYKGFSLAYSVYKDLREKGYVVTTGIKFGADFAVYQRGPGIDHAPFLISVKTKRETMGTFDIVRAGRLATTVRKQFIIATPEAKTGKVKYLMFRWFKA